MFCKFVFLLLDFVYGEKTVTYFSLDGGEGEEEGGRLFNPKQKVYSEYIEDAVKDLLVSSEVDQELKDSSIDVVDVRFVCFPTCPE